MGEWEDQYQNEVRAFVTKAKDIEKEWLTLDPENKNLPNPSYTFTTYSYRGMGWRKYDYMNIYSSHPCPRCKSKDYCTSSISAGCRHNGDGYGSDLIYCKTCGAVDYSSYDEA